MRNPIVSEIEKCNSRPLHCLSLPSPLRILGILPEGVNFADWGNSSVDACPFVPNASASCHAEPVSAAGASLRGREVANMVTTAGQSRAAAADSISKKRVDLLQASA